MKNFVIFFLLAQLILPKHMTAQNQNSRAGDEAALGALYVSTNGSKWDNNRGWSASDMSLDDNIYGVEVATVDGELRVVSVKLNGTTGWIRKYKEGQEGIEGGNNLRGTLPPEIGNLSYCLYFNVKNNYLTGTIPEKIGNMKSLQALYLNGRFWDFNSRNAHHPGKIHDHNERSNSFTGNFPSSIGKLSNLIYLEAAGTPNWTEDKIGNQGFTGPVPSSLNQLTKLEGLHLTFSSFTNIPDLSGLTNMINISFQNNNTTQSFPTFFKNMPNLRYLWMGSIGGGEDGTGFTGEIPDLSTLTKLEIFDFGANSITGNFPNYTIDGTMPNMNMLILAWNDNLGGSFGSFGKTNLTMLSVSGCSMTGELPPSLSNQKKMVNLNLGWNNFSGPFPDLSKMHQLRHVRANENNFTGTVPMVNTSNDALQFLHFQNNQMSGEIPAALAEIATLSQIWDRGLNISNNQFSDADLQPCIDALTAEGKLHILHYVGQKQSVTIDN